MKYLSVLFFTLLYLGCAIFFSTKAQNYEFVIYIGVVFLALLFTVLIYHQVGLTIPLLWCLSIWGLLHMMGGLYHVPTSWVSAGKDNVLYNWWIIERYLKFDQFVHAYGFGISTWGLWQALQGAIAKKFKLQRDEVLPTRDLLFLCMLAGIGLGAMNEVVEFIATLILPKTNVGGYVNTGWDLVFNLIGATIAAASIYLLSQKRIVEKTHS